MNQYSVSEHLLLKTSLHSREFTTEHCNTHAGTSLAALLRDVCPLMNVCKNSSLTVSSLGIVPCNSKILLSPAIAPETH